MMNIQYCFPTAILSTMNEKIAEEMLPLAKKYLSDKNIINKRIGYKSTYDSRKEGLEVYEEMKPFANYICELGMQFMLKQGYVLNFQEFKSNIFASEMHKNESHDMHTHPNSVLSGIIYLQVPEGSSPIIFYDPKGRMKYIVRETVFPTDSNLNQIHIQPKKGMILMWESWLEHSVPKNNNTKEGRITLVFNLNAQ